MWNYRNCQCFSLSLIPFRSVRFVPTTTTARNPNCIRLHPEIWSCAHIFFFFRHFRPSRLHRLIAFHSTMSRHQNQNFYSRLSLIYSEFVHFLPFSFYMYFNFVSVHPVRKHEDRDEHASVVLKLIKSGICRICASEHIWKRLGNSSEHGKRKKEIISFLYTHC